jgi:AbrB family looped-hinge helix DNA binding protein
MTTTIDGAGRVVVPKRLREQCGLSPGAELVIEAVADGVMIRPAHVRQVLVPHLAPVPGQ